MNISLFDVLLSVGLLVSGIFLLALGLEILLTPSDVWQRNHLISGKIERGEDTSREESLGLVETKVCLHTMTTKRKLTVLAMDRKRNYGK